MITVHRSITINRPIETVFEFVSDPSRIPEWRKDVIACTGSSNRDVGTEFIEKINFMGKKDFTMKIREFVPNRREVIENIAGPGARPIQTFAFTADGKNTRLDVQVEMRTFGFFRLLDCELKRLPI